MKDRDVVLCHPVRTAIGTFGGSLKEIPATDLGAAVIREAIRRSQVDATVGAVIMGNVIQAGSAGRHRGRYGKYGSCSLLIRRRPLGLPHG